MNSPKLLLCTDMDRTVIPNGLQSEHKNARSRFHQFCALPQVTLVYVTGRHRKLVKEAIKHYRLPPPDFVITDVGTKIYKVEGGQWQEVQAWEEEIDRDWKGKSHQQLKMIFNDLADLKIQESAKQNTHKLSYYVSLHTDKKTLLDEMAQRLEESGVDASLIWSVDEPKGIGLLDVLPRNATKQHAINFLQQQLGYSMGEVVFAGDSGNDLPVMVSEIPSVLVANAANDVQEEAQQMAASTGHGKMLYIATGKNSDMNGNYSAGVLEGVGHFCPEFRDELKQYGFSYDQ